MAEYLDEIPAAKAVSLHDIYRVIAGHSYYHGDRILAALTCIVEGKEVNPVRPADVAPVVHGEWLLRHEGYGHYWECSVCHTNPCIYVTEHTKFCPNCGAKMDMD